MELDELKESWKTLDKQLEKQSITTEEQVSELIAGYRRKTGRRLGNLMSLQRVSLTLGLLMLVGIGVIIGMLPAWCDNVEIRVKTQVVLVFLALTLIGGGTWDWCTYQYIQRTRVDLMPIAEVSRRIVRLRLWNRYEMLAISLWAVLFCAIYYWLMEFYRLPMHMQAFLICVFILFEGAVIYLLYKRLIDKHLNHIKKDIEDLKDLCTESH